MINPKLREFLEEQKLPSDLEGFLKATGMREINWDMDKQKILQMTWDTYKRIMVPERKILPEEFDEKKPFAENQVALYEHIYNHYFGRERSSGFVFQRPSREEMLGFYAFLRTGKGDYFYDEQGNPRQNIVKGIGKRLEEKGFNYPQSGDIYETVTVANGCNCFRGIDAGIVAKLLTSAVLLKAEQERVSVFT